MTMYHWNAHDYAQHSRVQMGWAQELLNKLHLQGNEAVLDLGCGDGKITALIAAKVPKGKVVGIDNSDAMIQLARSKYPNSLNTNLFFELQDFRDLSFNEQFDVVFSNAALHWVKDHRRVLERIQKVLRVNGRILLQMGGTGNAAGMVAAVDEVRSRNRWSPFFHGFEFPYGFYGPEEYRTWLHEAGFIDLRVELIPKVSTYNSREEFEGWFRTTWLPYIERVPLEQRQFFIDEVLDAYMQRHPESDHGIQISMVRLEVEALKR